MSPRRLIKGRLAQAAFHFDLRSSPVTELTSNIQNSAAHRSAHAERCTADSSSMLPARSLYYQQFLGSRPRGGCPAPLSCQGRSRTATLQPSRGAASSAGQAFPSLSARHSLGLGLLGTACGRWHSSHGSLLPPPGRGGRLPRAGLAPVRCAARKPYASAASCPPHLLPIGQLAGRSSTTSAVADRRHMAPGDASPHSDSSSRDVHAGTEVMEQDTRASAAVAGLNGLAAGALPKEADADRPGFPPARQSEEEALHSDRVGGSLPLAYLGLARHGGLASHARLA